jgi:hypothetical protein
MGETTSYTPPKGVDLGRAERGSLHRPKQTGASHNARGHHVLSSG